MHDLIIVGGGPAGAAAAVYAARKRLKTVFLTSEWGGQSTVSADIHNWIGTPSISGDALAKALRAHVESYAGEFLTVVSPALAASVEAGEDRVAVVARSGERFEARALLVATGSTRRKLEVPGAAEFDQKGLTYCASCDGPLFADQDVAVIGGGNAAFETALQLLAYCKSVTLFNRTENFRADAISVAAANANPKFRAITNAQIVSIQGEKFVSGVQYRNVATGEAATLPASGVFVEIGLLPNTEWLGESARKNQIGQLVVDPLTQRSSHRRIWAAGDCTSGLYHQNNIAAGDAVKALEDLYLFLHREEAGAQ